MQVRFKVVDKGVTYYVRVPRGTCPLCKGRCIRVQPRDNYEDALCRLCEGRGWVPARVCVNCGRPAWAELSQVAHCTRESCIKQLFGYNLPDAEMERRRFGEIVWGHVRHGKI